MANYFDEIAKNNLRSLLLMGIFFMLFAAIVWLLVWAFGGGLFLFVIGLIFIAIYAAIVYFSGDRMLLSLEGAKEVDQKQYETLYSIVDGLAQATQVPMPKVYIINDRNPNAFATGKNRKASAICVTSGLLSMMSNDELTGVIAHEMSHIQDNDIKFMMIAVVFAGVIGLISVIFRNMLWFGGGFGRDRNGGVLLIVALVIGIVAPIVAFLVRLAISRRREYMADANGARIIRNPAALASALKKIKKYEENPNSPPVQRVNEITAPLYFANPLNKSNIANLLSTHPPIEKRIEILEKMY